MTAVGLGAGVAAALALTAVFERFLGVETMDVWSYALPAVVLAAVDLGHQRQ